MSVIPKAVEENLQHCIEVATHDLLKEADWQTNMTIVDMINKNDLLAEYVIKFLKPRLGHRKPHIRTLAIQLLSSIIDNCESSRIHFASPTLLTFIVATLPKAVREPRKKHLFGGSMPADVVELRYVDLVLATLKRWAVAFRDDHYLHAFYDTFRLLLQNGVRFPDIDPASLPPITQDAAAQSSDPATLTTPSTTTSPAAAQKDAVPVFVPPPQPEILNIPTPEQVKFKDSKRAVELCAALVDAINMYAFYPVYKSPEPKRPPTPDIRSDEEIVRIHTDVKQLLSAVLTAISSGAITDESKVAELITVNDAITAVDRYAMEILVQRVAPGSSIRLGQEEIYFAYVKYLENLHRQKYPSVKQVDGGVIMGPGHRHVSAGAGAGGGGRPSSVGGPASKAAPARGASAQQGTGTPTLSANPNVRNVNIIHQDVLPAVFVPGKTIAATGGEVQPIQEVSYYDNANDIRPATGTSKTSDGGRNSAYHKPPVHDDFTSIAFDGQQQQQRRGSSVAAQGVRPTGSGGGSAGGIPDSRSHSTSLSMPAQQHQQPSTSIQPTSTRAQPLRVPSAGTGAMAVTTAGTNQRRRGGGGSSAGGAGGAGAGNTYPQQQQQQMNAGHHQSPQIQQTQYPQHQHQQQHYQQQQPQVYDNNSHQPQMYGNQTFGNGGGDIMQQQQPAPAPYKAPDDLDIDDLISSLESSTFSPQQQQHVKAQNAAFHSQQQHHQQQHQQQQHPYVSPQHQQQGQQQFMAPQGHQQQQQQHYQQQQSYPMNGGGFDYNNPQGQQSYAPSQQVYQPQQQQQHQQQQFYQNGQQQQHQQHPQNQYYHQPQQEMGGNYAHQGMNNYVPQQQQQYYHQ